MAQQDWFTANAPSAARSDVKALGKAEADDPREQIQEPSTFWSGFGKSILDQMGVGQQNSPIERAARPQNIGDVSSLLMPNAADAAVAAGPMLSKGASAVKQFGDRAGITAADFVPPIIQRNVPQVIPKIIRALRTDPLPVGESRVPLGPQEAADFDRLDVGPTRTPFGPKVGAPPTKFVGAKVVSPSPAANLEATAPIMPDVDTLKATMLDPTAADTPRDFRTGETGATREDMAKGTYNPAAVRAKQTHTAINQEAQVYRTFADQARAALESDPSIRTLLLNRLFGGPQ